jgi:hypothetical protein
MWTRLKACDACQNAPARIETQSGFFLCEECETVVVVAFEEFELPATASIGEMEAQCRREPTPTDRAQAGLLHEQS